MNTSDSSQPDPSGLQVELGVKPGSRPRAIWLLPVLVFLAATVLMVGRLSATPTIQWSPASVLEFLLPNSSQKLTVTFRSNESLSQIDVVVTPGLRSVLSVRPTRLTKISANKDYKFDLVVTAPASSGVAFQGTIQLKLTQGTSATQSSPLPIKIVIHDEPVPPDPGEAGKLTLEGIDSDGDGVRDDIYRWILSTYIDSPRTRAALTQYVKVEQTFLLTTNKELALTLRNQRSRAQDCLDYILGIDASLHAHQALRAELRNTLARTNAYTRANALLNGEVFTVSPANQWKSGCDFDLDVLAR